MNKMNPTRKNAAEAVDDVIAEATTKARRVRDTAARKLDAVTETPGADIRTDLGDLVRRHPTAALAGAAMVGAILSGMLLRAGRR